MFAGISSCTHFNQWRNSQQMSKPILIELHVTIMNKISERPKSKRVPLQSLFPTLNAYVMALL